MMHAMNMMFYERLCIMSGHNESMKYEYMQHEKRAMMIHDV